MFREGQSLNSSLNSSFNTSQTSTLSQSWGGMASPLSSSYVFPNCESRTQRMYRPLSMANSYNAGVSGPQVWQNNSNQTNSLADILAKTSIQGLTDEHISRLFSPINSNSNSNSNQINEISMNQDNFYQ